MTDYSLTEEDIARQKKEWDEWIAAEAETEDESWYMTPARVKELQRAARLRILEKRLFNRRARKRRKQLMSRHAWCSRCNKAAFPFEHVGFEMRIDPGEYQEFSVFHKNIYICMECLRQMLCLIETRGQNEKETA